MSIDQGDTRRRRGAWLALALAAAGLGVTACSASVSAGTDGDVQPATVRTVPGRDVKSVTLSENAAKRVGVEMVAITTAPSGRTRTTVPYAAVLYSPDGKTWVYREIGALTYIRETVVVANVGGADGTEATLTAGPPVGTRVVKTGVIELYGAELGVGA